MKPINLLPRTSLAVRMFKPVIAVIILLTVIFAAVIIQLQDLYKRTNRLIEADIVRLDSQLAELAASEQPPRYADVIAYRSLVEQLEHSGRDWEPVLELIAGLLPPASSITSTSADEDGKVTLAVVIPTLDEIVAYAAALRETVPIGDAAILSFQLETHSADGQSGSVYSAVIELSLADRDETWEAGS